MDGVSSLSLRGVNWLGEYDASRPHAPVGRPWWHVPTVKFSFGQGRTAPGVDETLVQVEKLIHAEWPALAAGSIVGIDQETTGHFGGFDKDGRPESVTRIAIDMGASAHLPEIKLFPERTLPWPRHPVTWVKADNVRIIPVEQAGSNYPEILAGRDTKTSYVVSGTQSLRIEARGGPRDTIVTDLSFQGSVAERFLRSFPTIFRAPEAVTGNRLGLERPGSKLEGLERK